VLCNKNLHTRRCSGNMECGFTLIEILVVVAIMAGMLTLGVNFWKTIGHAEEREGITTQMDMLGTMVFEAVQAKDDAAPFPATFAAAATILGESAPDTITVWNTNITLTYSGNVAVLTTTIPAGDFGSQRSSVGFMKMVGQNLTMYVPLNRVGKEDYFEATQVY